MPTARVSSPCSGEMLPELPAYPLHGASREIDVLILGAGPAGLSVGFELQRRRLPFLILEKGSAVGESWANMPRALKLVSPWKSNSLPGTPRNLFRRHDQLTREEFLKYLRAYAKKYGLSVESDTEVQAVEKLPDGRFRVRTSQGDLISRIVVNATGYFSNPFVPLIPGAEQSKIPQLHFAAYRDAQQIASILHSAITPGPAIPSPLKGVRGNPRPECTVLIVGKRLSAGQIVVELVEAGFTVALSHRSPIQYGAEPWAWWFLFRIFPWLEWIKLKLKGSRAPSNDVRMPGGAARKMIAGGRVKTFPAIRHFERDAVIFTNGERLRPDVVLFATGFRAALGHLAGLNISMCAESGRPQLRDLESVSVPGLFFIGLDHARNFQSRFLRGIRKDAAFLAGQVEQKLLTTSKRVPVG